MRKTQISVALLDRFFFVVVSIRFYGIIDGSIVKYIDVQCLLHRKMYFYFKIYLFFFLSLSTFQSFYEYNKNELIFI